MLNTIVSILVLLVMGLWCFTMIILANLKEFLEEDVTMENIIKVKPNKDGKIFITLYGTKYQIVIEPATKPAKADK